MTHYTVSGHRDAIKVGDPELFNHPGANTYMRQVWNLYGMTFLTFEGSYADVYEACTACNMTGARPNPTPDNRYCVTCHGRTVVQPMRKGWGQAAAYARRGGKRKG